MAGLGDAASDIGNLINIYGESFVPKMGEAYLNLDTYFPRARFYAQLLEWGCLALKPEKPFSLQPI